MKRAPNEAFMKPLYPSRELANVIGTEARPRTQVIKDIWGYIKRHGLQNPKNKRNIIADQRLGPVFGKDEVTMFELAAILNGHLSKEPTYGKSEGWGYEVDEDGEWEECSQDEETKKECFDEADAIAFN